MKKQLLYFLFLLVFPFSLFPQGESTSYPVQQEHDSLNRLLYKAISKYAKTDTKILIPKIEKLIGEGAKPNGIVTISGSYRKPGTYIPIIKEFYKNKYRKYSYKTTPFHAAVASKNTIVVGKLLDLGADVNFAVNKDDYPLRIAAYKQDENMIFFLLDHGANIEHINLSKIDDITLIEKLHARGADISTVDWNKFLTDKEALKKLITLNPEFNGVALDFSKLFDDNDLFDFLLDNGMPDNLTGTRFDKCPLFYGAVKYGNLYALKKLYARNPAYINKECKENFRKTPLTIAIDEENVSVIKFLLEKGANPMQKDWTGRVSINHTVFTKNPEEICKLLIQYGADLEYMGYFGQTPLMHAVKLDEYIPAMTYIQLGANVNARGKYGETPLYLAVKKENIPMIKLLIENGADPKAKYNGKSLLQYAQDEELSPMVIDYLKNL